MKVTVHSAQNFQSNNGDRHKNTNINIRKVKLDMS